MTVDLVQVHLIDNRAPATTVDGYWAVLDSSEQERAEGIRSEVDRRRYVVAHGAFRAVVGEQVGLAPDEVVWTYGEQGKPTVAGVHANLSHSGEFSLVATCSTRSVGVDLQQIVPSLDATAMARRFFANADSTVLAGIIDPRARQSTFATLWTRKEALVKAAGGHLTGGLGVPTSGGTPLVVTWPRPPAAGPYRITDLSAPRGYRAAVALAGASPYLVSEVPWVSVPMPPVRPRSDAPEPGMLPS
jgi:4'-phosphopantetheinyl transferase